MARRKSTENQFERAGEQLVQGNKKSEAIEKTETPVKSEAAKASANSVLAHAILAGKNKRNGQTRSLYIENDIYAKLKATAEDNGMSVSNLVNELLRNILM